MRTDNLIIPQGTTWEMHWPIIDETGHPADLTGWAARSQIRPSVASGTLLYTFDASIVGSDVVLSVSSEASTAWVWTDGVYDIEIFNGDDVVRVTQGRVTVDQEVTR